MTIIRKTFVIFFIIASFFMGRVSYCVDFDMDNLKKAFFSNGSRIKKPSDNNSQRGHAKELRPEIHVPPLKNIDDTEEIVKDSAAGIKGNEKIDQDFLPLQVHRAPDASKKVRWMPPPAGFSTADTFNYLIYRQTHSVSSNIKNVLDTIHGNLMLDLTPFTIIVKPNKILVMLFGEKESYMEFTKLPSWSGASSDLKSDSMFVIEGKGFYPLSVHELTHLYFDGYFLPTVSPLWLSEGMSVYMQIHTSKEFPKWAKASFRRIERGDIIPFEKLTTDENLNAYSSDDVALWYTQAYSVVDYLLAKRGKNDFYNFCNELKNNVPLHQALFHSYGRPFTKVEILEQVWLHDIQKAIRGAK